MFVKYATAFVCFPGGFGTMDEFFESMTLIQTEKSERFPVLLVGSTFWKPLVDWMRAYQLPAGYISDEGLELFEIIDDIDSVVDRIVAFHASRPASRAGEVTPLWRSATAEGTTTGKQPQRPRRRTAYEDLEP